MVVDKNAAWTARESASRHTVIMDVSVLYVFRVAVGFQSVTMDEHVLIVETAILMDISNTSSRLVLSTLSVKTKARSTSLGVRFKISEPILKNNSKIRAMNGCLGITTVNGR